MLQLDHNSGVSVCDQIVNGILRLKAVGALKEGDQLPSVRQLAVKLAVNPNTIQKAYAVLESNGVIVSQPGKGSFLAAGEFGELGVIKMAEESFRQAVFSAKRLGLTNERLKAILEETQKEETT